MRRVLSLVCVAAVVLSIGVPVFAAKKTVVKPKRKITVTKPAAPRIAPAPAAPAPRAAAAVPAEKKCLVLKSGLAGGACLLAAEYLMPMGPVKVGGEAGYAIGNSFGIIDAGVKVLYSMGAPFVGLEVSYAGYSKDVKQVPGLSGTIKAGAGAGLVAGMVFDPFQVQVGYNTALGVRADAGYRIYF